jgi:hypothetical protein
MANPLVNKDRKFFSDPEFYFLTFYNLLLFYLYYTARIDARTVVWGYYLQSLFIGLQYVGLSTIKKIKASGSLLPISQHSFTFFFMAHFGIFHLVYFVFLMAMSASGNAEQMISLIDFLKYSAGVLLLNTLFLFVRESISWTVDYPTPTVLGAYLRIIPIHLFIIFAPRLGDGITLKSFALFILLKLVVDLLIYIFTSVASAFIR